MLQELELPKKFLILKLVKTRMGILGTSVVKFTKKKNKERKRMPKSQKKEASLRITMIIMLISIKKEKFLFITRMGRSELQMKANMNGVLTKLLIRHVLFSR